MFEKFVRLQAFERANFPYIQSPIDSALLAEVGHHQEQGHPLTIKGLLLLKLGAPATVRRRMQRLVGLGLIHKIRVTHDRRICHLEIDRAVYTTYAKYLKRIAQLV